MSVKKHSIASYGLLGGGYGYCVTIPGRIFGQLAPGRYVNGKGYTHQDAGYSTSEEAIEAGREHVKDVLEKSKNYLNSAMLELNELESELGQSAFPASLPGQ